MRARCNKESAFSLLEVMCAILILGIGIVGLTQGITAALRSNKESELQTSAALLAAGQLETLRAEGYIKDGDTEGECEDDFSLFRWKQSVKKTSIDGLHEVQVVVENSKSGQTLFELGTLLFDAPLSDLPSDTSKDRKDSSKANKREGSNR